MKILFRGLILILLLAIFVAVLINKKQQINDSSTLAKQPLPEIPIKVTPVKLQTPITKVTTIGVVESSEDLMVISNVQGQIKSVNITVGKQVKKGDLLVEADDYFAQREYAVAKDAHQQLEKDYHRYEQLLGEDAITKQQLEQLKLQLEVAKIKQESLSKRLDDTRIKAAVNGTINQVFVKNGAMITNGTPICEIVNTSGLKVTSHFDKSDVGTMEPGQTLKLSENFGHGKSYNGVITGIGVKPDRTGRYPVTISISESATGLNPGLFLNIEINLGSAPCILIPRRMLRNIGGKYGVFISENNRANFVEVETGKSYGDDIEITEGLNQGMILITDGYQFMEVGSMLKVVE